MMTFLYGQIFFFVHEPSYVRSMKKGCNRKRHSFSVDLNISITYAENRSLEPLACRKSYLNGGGGGPSAEIRKT